MNVYKLTEEQKDQITGEKFNLDQIVIPLKDYDNQWYISQEVYNQLTLVRANELGVINWWFTLPLIPYNPVITELPI